MERVGTRSRGLSRTKDQDQVAYLGYITIPSFCVGCVRNIDRRQNKGLGPLISSSMCDWSSDEKVINRGALSEKGMGKECGRIVGRIIF